MSNMLEQAIIDAQALREVALKNAETAVIEKYSDQIKEAVESLLEQDELAPEEDPLASPGREEEMQGMLDTMPPASVEGEEACPCPEEEDKYEINFDQLLKQMEDEETSGAVSHEELADVMPPGEAEENLFEEIDLSEDELKDIIETLTVDLATEKRGWAGTPEAILELADDQLVATENDTAVKEEKEGLRKAVQELEKIKENLENKTLLKNKELKESKENTKKLEKLVVYLNNKLNETNISNAKLLYTNKVLLSTSLNERQKHKIVEALIKAETVKEAKVIYETLQSTVGSTLNKKQPKSLSEAVNRPTSTILLSRNKRDKDGAEGDSQTDRWKRLAGLI